MTGRGDTSLQLVSSALGRIRFSLPLSQVAAIEDAADGQELVVDLARLWGVAAPELTRRRRVLLDPGLPSLFREDGRLVQVLVGEAVTLTEVARAAVQPLPALLAAIGPRAGIRALYLTPEIGLLLDADLLQGAAS